LAKESYSSTPKVKDAIAESIPVISSLSYSAPSKPKSPKFTQLVGMDNWIDDDNDNQVTINSTYPKITFLCQSSLFDEVTFA
jgi:hypothetical protein